MMSRTIVKSKRAQYSLPLLKDRARDYLTREANNEEFCDKYSKRIEELNGQKTRIEQQIEDLAMEIKRLDGEEQLANLMPADKSKLKKLIPIYREKRNAKEKIKKLKEKVKDMEQKVEKTEHMAKSITIKENIFTAINIDLNKVRHRKTSEARLNRYHDKQIDIKKLKQVKRGLYLDILETANFNKLSFKKNEKKYDLQQILDKERQYKQESDIRMESAAMRHKARLERLENRHLQMKIMRNNGEYHPGRSSLYPAELLDDDYPELANRRGASASSVGRHHGISSSTVLLRSV